MGTPTRRGAHVDYRALHLHQGFWNWRYTLLDDALDLCSVFSLLMGKVRMLTVESTSRKDIRSESTFSQRYARMNSV